MYHAPEGSADERQRAIQRLVQSADQAHAIASALYQELLQIKGREGGPRLTPLAYSLGICVGDAESSISRLGGLRAELRQLAGMLEREDRSPSI